MYLVQRESVSFYSVWNLWKGQSDHIVFSAGLQGWVSNCPTECLRLGMWLYGVDILFGSFYMFWKIFFSCSPEFWRECDCLAKEHLGLVTYSDPLVGNLPILCSGGLVCYLGRVTGFGLCVLVSRRWDVLSGFRIPGPGPVPSATKGS